MGGLRRSQCLQHLGAGPATRVLLVLISMAQVDLIRNDVIFLKTASLCAVLSACADAELVPNEPRRS